MRNRQPTMMNHRRWLQLVFIVLIVLFQQGQARIFFVGSNPYMSYIAFPQDLLGFGPDFYYYYITYQQLPWWGDVDEPTNKPNATYTSTAQKTVNDRANGAFFEHKAGISVVSTMGGLVQEWPQGYRNFSEIAYVVDSRSGSAEGNLTNGSAFVPFKYKTHTASHDIGLKSTFATTRFWDIPLGFKFQFAFNNSNKPNTRFTFSKNAIQDYSSTKLLWGWSTAGCNHVFGAPSTDGDAWLQNEYAIGPLYRFDIQAGATLEKAKVGSRFRYITGKQDQYYWEQDSSQIPSIPDQVIWSNFAGSYQKSRWAKKTSDAIFRAYSNVNWRKNDYYAFNTLFFLGYESALSQNALASNLSVLDDRKSRLRNVVVEANPNINIFLPKIKAPFLDAAILLEYSYARTSNTASHWLPSGGQKEFYISSEVYESLEYSWENFSYANENFLDLGLDMSMNVPLYMRDSRRIALGLIMFLNSKYTFKTKYYGTATGSGSEMDFTIENLRKNYKREVWFNSAVSLNYWVNDLYVRVDLIEPLLYSLLPRTRVTDKEGKTVIYENKQSGNWASQEGVKLGVFVSRTFSLNSRKTNGR